MCLFEHVQEAIWRLDIAECVRFVSWANEHQSNEHPSDEVVEALSILVTRPTRRRFLRIWYHDATVEMRARAIEALGRTGLDTAAPALANSLMYESGKLQMLAKSAVVGLGERSLPSLLEILSTCRDWPLRGMLATIDALALLQHPGATPILISILRSQKPKTPVRWDRSWLKWSLGLGLFIAFFLTVSVALGWLPGDTFGVALFSWFAASAVWAVPVGLVMGHLKSRESFNVRLAATDAIVRIKDPFSIPDLLDSATGAYRLWARRNALDALAGVLPALRSEHFGMLEDATERKLLGLISADTNRLTLAVVRALEYIGTGQSAIIVDRFIRSKPAGAYNETLAAALNEAVRVLPVLQERFEQEQALSTLLRASQPDADTGEQLLRPAAGNASEVQADELLRPGN
jgi:HEAT repeat protein